MNRLPDSEQVKNAFEISGPLIERITVVCQGPTEANKWVELLSQNNETTKRRTGMELKRNISAGSMTGAAPTPPPHVSVTFPFSNDTQPKLMFFLVRLVFLRILFFSMKL